MLTRVHSPASDSGDGGGGETQSPEQLVSPATKENSDRGEEHSPPPEIVELRRRWELASVLNFLTVFEPMIGKVLKISAEAIERGLILPNSSLAQLHITLLKGIPPVSKMTLDGSDAWVTILCKKLAPWWPWVAEGKFPLVADKGNEISGYRKLDPTKRLLILKALCELRVEQADALAYINDAIREGTEVSYFCKAKLAGDGNGTTFWYEGDKTVGHRLYRGVTTFAKNKRSRGKTCLGPPSFQWETLATDLEEFRQVADEFSSSMFFAETVVSRTINDEVIPCLERIEKRKELAMKKKLRQERYLNHHTSSNGERPTRMCRSRNPDYSCDDYDRMMAEAIRLTRKRTKSEESKAQGMISGDSTTDAGGDDKDCAYVGEENSDVSDSGDSKADRKGQQTGRVVAPRRFGARWSTRLAGHAMVEIERLGSKRPVLNANLDCVVVDDSEEGES